MKTTSPTVPDSQVAIRPFVEGQDEDAWLAVTNAVITEDGTRQPITRDQYDRETRNPGFIGQGRFVAERGSQVVGLIHPLFSADWPGKAANLSSLMVHREFRRAGIGTALLERSIQDLRDRGAATINAAVGSENVAAVRFAESRDFLLSGTMNLLRCSLERLPDPNLRPGLSIREASNADAEALARVVNDTQQGVPGHSDVTGEDIREWFNLPGNAEFRVLRLIAELDGKAVGYLAGMANPPEIRTTGRNSGRINEVGVYEQHRRQAIGRALLLHGLRACRDSGRKEVEVFMDGKLLERAHRFPESVGFSVARRWLVYERSLRDSPGRPGTEHA